MCQTNEHTHERTCDSGKNNSLSPTLRAGRGIIKHIMKVMMIVVMMIVVMMIKVMLIVVMMIVVMMIVVFTDYCSIMCYITVYFIFLYHYFC